MAGITMGPEGQPRPFDPALITRMMEKVAEAKVINNLYLIPMNNPLRFVLAQVDEETNEITTLGYIPFDFMLDIGIGFISAVRNAVQVGMANMAAAGPGGTEGGDGDESEEPPLAGGLFKVI